MAHGRGDLETAVKVAATAANATAALDDETRVLYLDLIESALGAAARKAFAMIPEGYQFQGPSFKKGKREGKREGKLEGQLEGRAADVLEVLDARGIQVTAEIQERVRACQDPEQLRQWLRRAAVVASSDELFAESFG